MAQPFKQCPRCQQLSAINAAFCSQCGHQFRTQFSPDQTQVVAPPPPYQPPQYAPPGYPVPYAEQKSRVAAALFALFLGAFGAHGFYLGNTAMGITLLATTLVSFPLMLIGIGSLSYFAVGIICLVQAILYIAASDYDFQRKYVVEKRWF